MNHQPYESWLTSDEPLLPENEQMLQEHIESCESCRQLSYAWVEVQDLFREPQLALPSSGFAQRWQAKLMAVQLSESERQQKRLSWAFFTVMAVQAPVRLFIGGLTLIAGLLNLATAVQIALIPFLNVIVVSVPTYWWFILVIAACLLTLVLAFSARRILYPRRVSL